MLLFEFETLPDISPLILAPSDIKKQLFTFNFVCLSFG